MVRGKALVLLVGLAVAIAAVGSVSEPGGSVRRIRLPALPEDLPLPAAGTLRTARDLGSRGLNLVFETEEAPADAARGLRSRLEAAGWVALSDVVLEKADFSSYRKGERSVAIGVSRSGSLSLVSVAYLARPDVVREENRG